MSTFSSTGPSDGDLCIRGGEATYIGLKVGSVATTPVGFAILTATYTGDDQSFTVILGDEGRYDQTGTYIYTHSDAAHTVGAYCRIRLNQVQIGSYTRSGAVYTYIPFAGGTTSLDFATVPQMWGSRFEFRNVGTAWTVWINGANQVLAVTNASVTFGATRRKAAISMERKTSPTAIGPLPAGAFESFRIAGISMNDNVTPAQVGSGAKMARLATSGDNGSGASERVFPTSFFDTLVISTGDITADLSTSKFTVSIDGWYKVTLRHASAIPNNTSVLDKFHHSLFKNGSLYERGSERIPSYNGTDVIWATGMQSTWSLYLKVGDYVQAAYTTSNAITGLFVGEATGTESYFSIALLTRNLL